MKTLTRNDSLRALDARVIPKPLVTPRGNWPWNHHIAACIHRGSQYYENFEFGQQDAIELFLFCQDVPRFRFLSLYGESDNNFPMVDAAYYEPSFIAQGHCLNSNLGTMNPSAVEDKQHTKLTTTQQVTVNGYYVTGTLFNYMLQFGGLPVKPWQCLVEVIGSGGVLHGSPWYVDETTWNQRIPAILHVDDYNQAIKDNNNRDVFGATDIEVVGLFAPPV